VKSFSFRAVFTCVTPFRRSAVEIPKDAAENNQNVKLTVAAQPRQEHSQSDIDKFELFVRFSGREIFRMPIWWRSHKALFLSN